MCVCMYVCNLGTTTWRHNYMHQCMHPNADMCDKYDKNKKEKLII